MPGRAWALYRAPECALGHRSASATLSGAPTNPFGRMRSPLTHQTLHLTTVELLPAMTAAMPDDRSAGQASKGQASLNLLPPAWRRLQAQVEGQPGPPLPSSGANVTLTDLMRWVWRLNGSGLGCTMHTCSRLTKALCLPSGQGYEQE